MADEFVRIGQFEQFCRGNDQRFLDLEKKMDQGFAHAAKEREQNFVHLNQRLDDLKDDLKDGMNRRFDNLEKRFDDLRKIVMIMLTALVGATVVAVVGAAVKYIFFSG